MFTKNDMHYNDNWSKNADEVNKFASMSAIRTLADLKRFFDEETSENPRRGAYRSACATMGRVLGQQLDLIPVEPPVLKAMLDDAMPATAGINAVRWRHVRSLVSRALRDAGAGVVLARSQEPLTAEWQALFDALPGAEENAPLTRLLRWLSRGRVPPKAFTVEVFQGFRTDLEARALSGNPAAICRRAARRWNEAIELVVAWPKVPLPVAHNTRSFSFEWEMFPPTFSEEVQRFLQAGLDADPFGDDQERPMREARPSTIKSRKDRLRIWATRLVNSGAVPIEGLTSLAVLVDIDNLKPAMVEMRRHAGGKITNYQCSYLTLAIVIARYWLRDLPLAARIEALERKARGAANHKRGMTEKNSARLRQFDSLANMDALYRLPTRVFKALAKAENIRRNDAVRAMHAIEVAILSFAPLRLENLRTLRLGHTIVKRGRKGQEQYIIDVPAREMKNAREYSAPLPERLTPLIDAWLLRYRPLICSTPTDLLFPGPSGGLRNKTAAGQHLSKFVKRETGLVMNPHLFRSLAVKVCLEANPFDAETPRRILGHANGQTTFDYYAELRSDSAFRRYEQAHLDRPLAQLRKVEQRRAKKRA